MPRRPVQSSVEVVRQELVDLLANFKTELQREDLRERVLSLVAAFHLLRDLGSSLFPSEIRSAARDRILSYLLKYPYTVIHGDELMVVSGIQDWPRRVRELRRELGWSIASGVTIREMLTEDEIQIENVDLPSLKPEEYVLLSEQEDREAAHRWKLANESRRKRMSVRDKMLEFLRRNVGRPVTGEELRYIACNRTDWPRRVRELRTELGWPVATKTNGRPDLPVGVYVLEENRQSPSHDRQIPDPVRRAVLMRDNYACKNCGWSHKIWNPSDPRHLEIHHIKHHVKGGDNTEENLTTLCTVCHDRVHRA